MYASAKASEEGGKINIVLRGRQKRRQKLVLRITNFEMSSCMEVVDSGDWWWEIGRYITMVSEMLTKMTKSTKVSLLMFSVPYSCSCRLLFFSFSSPFPYLWFSYVFWEVHVYHGQASQFPCSEMRKEIPGGSWSLLNWVILKHWLNYCIF